MAAVVIRVVDEAVAPVEGVVVSVYNEDNDTLLFTSTTDAAGESAFTLPVARYAVRFYSQHLLFTLDTLSQINVKDPPYSGTWQFAGTNFVAPVSPDPRFCRCWAYFLSPSGQRQENLYLRLAPSRNPVAVYASPEFGVSQSAVELFSDADGYIQVDLPREGGFSVTMAGFLDCAPDIVIPDHSSFNLVDLLFPYPQSLTFAPVGPLAVGVGSTADVVPTLTMSDGEVLTMLTSPIASEYIEFASGNEAVLTVAEVAGAVQITGVAPGTTTVTATVRDGSVYPRLPISQFTVVPVTVTVS